MDLSILSIETLGAIKRDAIETSRKAETHVAVRIECREVLSLVDRELDRRADWANAVLAALAATDVPEVETVDLTDTVHTVRGKVIGPEGSPYGVTHDGDCPGCASTPFTASPRSETYWSS